MYLPTSVMEVTTEEVVSKEQQVERTQLKLERRLRNKQKRAAKKLLKQKEQEQKELVFKLQLKSNNVTLITRDIADKVAGNSGATDFYNQKVVNDAEFPMLGAKCKVNSPNPNTTSATVAADEKKRLPKIELADFLHVPTISKLTKPISQTIPNYGGNPLDSDMPVRKRGKHREVPKVKKLSKLKREIMKDNCEDIQEEFEELLLENSSLCDNTITNELNDLITVFISALVGLQEKLYKRDPLKGKSKRRYVVGIHEVKKYLNLNKVKLLIMGTDIKLIKPTGAISYAVEEIIELAKANNTPYLFALKRRSLGKLTMKHIPVSCVAVLNYEGIENHFDNVIQVLPTVKKPNSKNCVEDEINKKCLNNLMEALKCNN